MVVQCLALPALAIVKADELFCVAVQKLDLKPRFVPSPNLLEREIQVGAEIGFDRFDLPFATKFVDNGDGHKPRECLDPGFSGVDPVFFVLKNTGQLGGIGQFGAKAVTVFFGAANLPRRWHRRGIVQNRVAAQAGDDVKACLARRAHKRLFRKKGIYTQIRAQFEQPNRVFPKELHIKVHQALSLTRHGLRGKKMQGRVLPNIDSGKAGQLQSPFCLPRTARPKIADPGRMLAALADIARIKHMHPVGAGVRQNECLIKALEIKTRLEMVAIGKLIELAVPLQVQKIVPAPNRQKKPDKVKKKVPLPFVDFRHLSQYCNAPQKLDS